MSTISEIWFKIWRGFKAVATASDGPGTSGRVPWLWIAALGGLALLELVLGIMLVLESIDVLADDPLSRRSFHFLWWSGKPHTDTIIIMLALGAGVVGSFVQTATSLVKYIGNRKLRTWWVPFYVARAPIAAALAVIVYLLVRGGLFPGNGASEEISGHGVAALAGLAGMFSNKAVDKLEQVFSSAFGTDTTSTDSLAGDGPTIDRVEWDAEAATPSLLIRGTHFTDGALAVIDGEVVSIATEEHELLRVELDAEILATRPPNGIRIATGRGLTAETAIPAPSAELLTSWLNPPGPAPAPDES